MRTAFASLIAIAMSAGTASAQDNNRREASKPMMERYSSYEESTQLAGDSGTIGNVTSTTPRGCMERCLGETQCGFWKHLHGMCFLYEGRPTERLANQQFYTSGEITLGSCGPSSSCFRQ